MSALLLALALADSSNASTAGTVVPLWRGQAQTEAALWELFGSPYGTNNSPNAGTNVFIQTGDGTIVQQDTNAFITGPVFGNIYNAATNSVFELTDSTPYTLGQVSLQVRTLGSEIDYANVSLEYDLGSGPEFLFASRTELLRESGMGVNVVSLWQWDVWALGISDYKINFAGEAVHMSLDAVVLDTASVAVVPEPGTWALISLGTLGLVTWARRRR